MLWQAQLGQITGRGALVGVGTAAPVNTVLPVISGSPAVGSTLSTTNGTWTGSPTPTYAYQWKRNGGNIGGATSSTYLLVIADLTTMIAVAVTATNTAGGASATSVAVGPISSAPATARSAVLMGLGTVVVNASTTARDANVNGVMVNLR